MGALTPKERLLKVLNKQEVDRPPVICPGGMMNAAIVEIMEESGHAFPEAHSDAALMAALAADVAAQSGFENLGLPFCLTVEAEALGSEVTYGSLICEPKITRELYGRSQQVCFLNTAEMVEDGRAAVVNEAVGLLARRFPELPVIGNLSGPISTAASLVDPIAFLKDLRKDPEAAHRVLEYVCRLLIAFAQKMVQQGADVIAISDPTATGEILGPKMFADYAIPYLNRVIDAVHEAGAPVIVHICGDLGPVKKHLPALRANAISTDALVDLRKLKEELPQLTVMGNLSTYLLEFGPAERVAKRASVLVEEGIDIIAPACGLGTATKLAHIQAMTAAVKGGA
nr:MtaA/CmuA family methyltransferase [uncultured Anaeromusa sp.]